MSFTNEALGLVNTAAGVTAAGKFVSNQKKANELAEISQTESSYNEAKGLIKESEELVDTERQLQEGIEATQQDIEEKSNWSGPFRDEKGRYQSKDKYMLAKEIALKEMQDQVKAVGAQKFDLNARLDLYNKRIEVLKLDKKGIAPDINKIATPEQLNKINYIRGGNK